MPPHEVHKREIVQRRDEVDTSTPASIRLTGSRTLGLRWTGYTMTRSEIGPPGHGARDRCSPDRDPRFAPMRVTTSTRPPFERPCGRWRPLSRALQQARSVSTIVLPLTTIFRRAPPPSSDAGGPAASARDGCPQPPPSVDDSPLPGTGSRDRDYAAPPRVGDWDPGVEGRQRAGKGRRRVTLHDDQVPVARPPGSARLSHAAPIRRSPS